MNDAIIAPSPSSSPSLSLDRSRLFPPSIARSVGLDPEKHALLEVPNGSSFLYNSLLLYAAHFAVDLQETLPSSTSSTGWPSTSSSTTQHDPSSPLPSLSENGQDEIDLEGQFGRGLNGTLVSRREGPGRLSTLWNCPDDRCDPLTFSDSDSESDDEWDLIGPAVDSVLHPDNNYDAAITYSTISDEKITTATDEPRSDGTGTETCTETDAVKSIKSYPIGLFLAAPPPSPALPRRRMEPPIARYQMGIGFAKLVIGDAIVYIHHCAFGMPVSEGYSVQVFRTVALAAAEAWPLKEACALALKWRSNREQRGTCDRTGRFCLFRWNSNGGGCGEWCNQGYKRSRPANSIILPDGQLESIVRDIKDFLGADSKAWYQAHGLPFRRSFLFYGPPGSGKSSTIKMIAGLFRLNACFLGFTGEDFCNQMLQDTLTSLPRRALLILEDVDVLFNEDRRSETTQSLTFSGMLNALDGLISAEGIVTIFTTNHIEKLDRSLIRGGRVDRRFEFVHPSSEQMEMLFKSFYGNAPDSLAKQFAERVLARPEEEARSIATLQQHFIYTRHKTAEESVNLVDKFFADFYPTSTMSSNPLYI